MTSPEIHEVLYHGTPNRDVLIFEPRQETIRDPQEGPAIFATPSLATATCFLLRVPMECGRFNATHYYVAERNNFIANDFGGAIYSLSADTFVCEPGKGMGMLEWVSKVSVRPIEKKEHNKALGAMLENGVQVYLVDSETLSQIKAAEDYGHSILQGTESENYKSGINVKEL